MKEKGRGVRSELAALIEQKAGADGVHATTVPRLFLIRYSRPTEPLHSLHEPALCIVVQGRKRVMLGEKLYVYGPEQCLVVSVDLPVVGQVIEATPEAPYLCLRFDLDLGQLGELMIETGFDARGEETQGPALSLMPVSPELLDAAHRLARLLDAPKDIAVLAPLITREIFYRLLSGEQGACVRRLARADGRLRAVNRAIGWLKENYAEPFRVERLAREAGMSPSALHHNFKAVTAMSPLQYQKRLRLQEARRLMLGQALDAATAAHNVGYESPSQFSREYRRLFGAPPSRDMARLKNIGALAAGNL